LLGSSYFYLKAREIAQRAVKSIALRDEKEKQNCYIPMLNIESMFCSRRSLQEGLPVQRGSGHPCEANLVSISKPGRLRYDISQSKVLATDA